QDALRVHSVAARVVRREDLTSGGGLIVCDAESDADLSKIARSEADFVPPVLWCGSAGLAHTLAGSRRLVSLPHSGSRLGIIGSRHDVARAQLRRLAVRCPHIVVTLAAADAQDHAVAAVTLRLSRYSRAALALDLPLPPGGDVEALLTQTARRLVNEVSRPD